MALNDVYQAAFIMRHEGEQNVVMTMAYKVTQIVGAEPTPNQYAAGLSTAFAAVIKPLLTSLGPTGDSYRGMLLRQVLPAVTATVITNTAAGAGTRLQSPSPGGICLALTNRCSSAPPGVRGRSFLPRPGIGADIDNKGNPSAGYITDAQTIGTFVVTDQVINPVAGVQGTLTACVWSRKHGAAYVITQSQAETQWSTQRRRMNIRGLDNLLL